jgi:hypothetical protein
MKEPDKSRAQTANRVPGPPNTSAREAVISARDGPVEAPFRSVEFRPFAHARCGATNFSTGLATFSSGAAIPYHQHEYSWVYAGSEPERTLVDPGGRLKHS